MRERDERERERERKSARERKSLTKKLLHPTHSSITAEAIMADPRVLLSFPRSVYAPPAITPGVSLGRFSDHVHTA